MNNFNITEWVDEFFQYSQNEKDFNLDTNILMMGRTITVMEIAGHEIPKHLADTFSFKLIRQRANVVGLNCSDYFCLLLSTVCHTPGNAVMWISVFRHLQDAEEVVPGVKPRYDADYFLRITELKIPTESYLQKMWDAQKNRDPAFRVDNWLDVIATNGAFIEATRKGYVEMVAN